MADHYSLGDLQRVHHANDILRDAGDGDSVTCVCGAGSAICIECDAAVELCKVWDHWVVVVL